jgi:hypothetical protein
VCRERESIFKKKNGDLCVERERGGQFFLKKKWRLEYVCKEREAI